MFSPQTLSAQDALIIVDVQQDFCPEGQLPVPEGDTVIPVLNSWITAAMQRAATVIYSRDCHPADHSSFTTHGGIWPVHCVAGSEGAALHPQLLIADGAIMLEKGTQQDTDQYSAFDGSTLVELLQARGIQRVWVGGLALDVCVKATALDAVAAGFATALIPSGSLPVTPQGGKDAIMEMQRSGILICQDATV